MDFPKERERKAREEEAQRKPRTDIGCTSCSEMERKAPGRADIYEFNKFAL